MTVRTVNATGTLSERLNTALKLPNGARFYRCALQVNPFAYLARNNKQTTFKSEAEYNAAIVEACRETEVEVIGVTDHYRFDESKELVKAAREAGIFAFGGFEAVTKDGVHFLCLFDPERDDMLERFIGDCGVHDTRIASPTGSLDSIELLAKAQEWGSICVAAHVAAAGGLLRKLNGQPRANAWKSPDLLACALAGPISAAPNNIRPILENKDVPHRRPLPIAVINASDVNSPEDLKKDAASCFIKMSSVSVEALRQSFLDPQVPHPPA